MHAATALAAIAPSFILILIGVVLRRGEWLDSGFWKGAEKLTHWLFFPAYLVHTIATAGTMGSTAKSTVLILGAVTLVITLGVLLGCRYLRVVHATFTSIMQGSVRFNSFIFLSVASQLLTPEDYGVAAVVVAYMVAISNTVVLLAFGSRDGSVWGIVLKVCLNPLILASGAGLALNLSGVLLPQALAQPLSALGAPALPLSLICVGAALQIPSGEFARLCKTGLLTASIRLGLFPLLAYALISAWPVPPLVATLVLLYSVAPCASNSYVLATQYGGDHRLMAFVVAVSTVLSFVPMFLLAGSLSVMSVP